MKKILLLVLLACTGVVNAAAEKTAAEVFSAPLKSHPERQAALQQLAAQIKQQGAITGEFVQQKHLAMLNKPITSSGRFALNPAQFVWQIEQPFAITYTFANEQLVRDMDGETQVVEASTEPMLYGFFSFFTSLFSLSEASLEQYFTVFYLSAGDESWIMGLVPKQAMLARSLKQLEVHGHEPLIV